MRSLDKVETTVVLVVGALEYRLHALTANKPLQARPDKRTLYYVQFDFLLHTELGDGGYKRWDQQALDDRTQLILDAQLLTVRTTTGQAVLEYRLSKIEEHQPDYKWYDHPAVFELPLDRGYCVSLVGTPVCQVYGTWEFEAVS